jgi:predicted HTH domain antitoxin
MLQSSLNIKKGGAMKMPKVTVEIEVPPAIHGTKLEQKYLSAANRIVEERAVVRLFEQGDVSSGYAAELLGITKYEFLELLKSYNVPFFNMSDEEWQREIETIGNLREEIRTSPGESLS